MKTKWLLGALLLLTVVTFLYYRFEKLDVTKSEYAALLHNTPEFIDASRYSTEELRHVLFARELRTNPPFSLSQTELQKLSPMLDELEDNMYGFQSLYGNEGEKMKLRDHLYPIVFLRQAIETEEKRRLAIETPNQSNAEAYLVSLKTTLDSYKQYIATLKAFVRNSREFPYGMIDGSIENHNLITWLGKLEERAASALNWIELQSSCLERYAVDCSTSYTLRWPIDERPISTSTYTQLELDFANHFVELERINPTGGNGEPAAEVPLVEYHGYCSKYGDARYARIWWNHFPDRPHISYARFVYVDDPLFFNHEENGILFSKFMTEFGVPYQHQPVNHYMCNHYASDFAAITSTYAVWQAVKIKDIPEQDSPELEKLRQLETTLRNATTTIKYTDVIQYIAEVDRLLSSDVNYFDENERTTLEDLLLGYRDSSFYLQHRIGSLVKLYEFSYANFQRIAVPNAEYIILGFSVMPLTLLADNPEALSFAGLPVRKYAGDVGYPHLFSGLDTLQNQKQLVTDPLKYLEHTLEVIRKLKRHQI